MSRTETCVFPLLFCFIVGVHGLSRLLLGAFFFPTTKLQKGLWGFENVTRVTIDIGVSSKVNITVQSVQLNDVMLL